MSDQLKSMMKKLEGDGPIEKHIILLKLKEVLDRAPAFGEKPVFEVGTPQRQWLAEAGALLSRLGLEKKVQFRASFSTLAQYWKPAVNNIMGQVVDAIEELKLEMELDGRNEFGSAYAPGDTYRFFADLKGIINTAQASIMVIDPYFNGESFDAYLAPAKSTVQIRILADRYTKDIAGYVAKHTDQYNTNIELRSSSELHDRLVLIDDDAAWIMGGSIKDAGKKATYLIPLASPIAVAKKTIYFEVWNRATKVGKDS